VDESFTYPPKALRAADAETVIADLLDLDSIGSALEGVTAAYFVYRISDTGLLDTTAFMAQAAKDAGVKGPRQHISDIGAARREKPRRA
jgi:uncharacterized protein YbjT (DUF2867 family)